MPKSFKPRTRTLISDTAPWSRNTQRSVVRVGVGELKEDVRTLGAASTRVDDCEGGVGDAGLSGVVRGVGVTRKLVLMLQMTITARALTARR